MVRDLKSGERVEGASTLTQQLARTLFLSNVRTYGRKVKEAAIALLIELQLSKPEILELYLNRVYLSAGVYGVEAMSIISTGSRRRISRCRRRRSSPGSFVRRRRFHRGPTTMARSNAAASSWR